MVASGIHTMPCRFTFGSMTSATVVMPGHVYRNDSTKLPERASGLVSLVWSRIEYYSSL